MCKTSKEYTKQETGEQRWLTLPIKYFILAYPKPFTLTPACAAVLSYVSCSIVRVRFLGCQSQDQPKLHSVVLKCYSQYTAQR